MLQVVIFLLSSLISTIPFPPENRVTVLKQDAPCFNHSPSKCQVFCTKYLTFVKSFLSLPISNRFYEGG